MGDENAKTKDDLVDEVRVLRRRVAVVEAERDRFRVVADFTYDWECWIGPDGGLVYCSPSCERITGYTPAEFLSRPGLFEEIVYPQDRPAVASHLRNELESRQPVTLVYRIVKRDGEVRWLEHVCYRIDDPVRGFQGRRSSNRDITDRQGAEGALRDSEQRLRWALEGSGGGAWDWDMATGEAWWSTEMYDLWGVEPGTPMRLENSLAFVHEEDRSCVTRTIEEALAKRADYRCEFRIRHPVRGERWMNSLGRAVYDEAGHAVRLLGITLDITARKAAEEELRQAKAAAEMANRAKSEFLANMSHEIRTPMTAILGFADLLTDHEWSEAERQEYLGIVCENGRMLLQLINDILDLSKIEAERMVVEKVVCSPVKLVEEVLSLMHLRAEEKGIALVAAFADDVPATISTDPIRLRQILVNLVGNAIKFTRQGQVTIRVCCRGDAGGAPCLEVAVADTGIGIPLEARETIFEPFMQADGSLGRRFGGTGLGLAISRRLAGLLGGTLEVESEVGRGSTFTLSIDPGPVDVPTPAGNGSDAAARAVAVPLRLPPARVLVVEDTMSGRRVVETMLQKFGLAVETVENGREACRAAIRSKAGGQPFDLILMDIQMPEMDGYEATRQLRRQAWRGPIVALTAHAMEGDREKCLAAGCDEYLSKPVSQDDLLELVLRLLTAAAR